MRQKNFDFELNQWKDGSGKSSAARYLMDTVLHHETGTSALYRINKYLETVKGLILEVGCNCGAVGMTLSKKPEVDFVVGVDFMTLALQSANRRMHLINNDIYPEDEEFWCHKPDWKIRSGWICAEATNLPFKDESFNTVLFPEIIEHLPRPDRPLMINEGFRLMKKDGVFLFSTPINIYDVNRPNWMDEIWKYVHPFGLETEESAVKIITDAGFKIVELENDWHDKIQVLFIKAVKL